LSFSIDVDVSELESAWREAAVPALNNGTVRAVREACAAGASEAVNTRIYQDRTANLTASIHGDEFLTITPDGAEGQITAGMEYASYVNEWEAKQLSDGFMDRAAAKAEAAIAEGIDTAAADAERRMNSR
jgi:hypothetical protein